MTAPMSLREYFAAANSPFTKQDAEVIGPQIEAMAEEGEVTERAIVDTAKSQNSPLHSHFEWDDAVAGDKYRLGQAGTMMRSIRVRFLQDDRPRTTPAYKVARAQPKSTFARGHNILAGDSAIAVRKAKEAFDELTSWRGRFQPFVIVWKEFAGIFQGVSNQISEAEDTVRVARLEDATDLALTELGAILTDLASWQDRHRVAPHWVEISEQAGFVVEAIDAALSTFGRTRAAERACIGCGRAFLSSGPPNRLCERCGTKSEGARISIG